MLLSIVAAGADQPFKVSACLDDSSATNTILTVSVSMAPHYRIYADQFHVEVPPPVCLVPAAMPAPEVKRDVFSGKISQVFSRDFHIVYRVVNAGNAPLPVTIRYQGCSQDQCFLPVEKTWLLSRKAPMAVISSTSVGAETAKASLLSQEYLKDFEIVAVLSGYVRPPEFIKFLTFPQEGYPQVSFSPTGWYRSLTWITIVIILLGGLALNLTPCVLPMIPINLAIIGAGVQAGGGRRQGMKLGFFYGAGMALAYGILGGIVVATGRKFGTLNASPWFNLAIAGIFLLLALAMFDVYVIDLTRFQKQRWDVRRHVLVVLMMGAISALLAGACVAPVVFSVVLLATDLVAKGNPVGLFLPLVLGIGMGLPWPLAGAGLSLLPKTGKWMNYVKYAFGVLILAAAMYYAVVGIRLWMRPAPAVVEKGWLTSIPDAQAQARKESRPILIDFGASWCKNCQAMEVTTLRDTGVQNALRRFVKVKYHVEHPNQSPDRDVLDQFGVIGLPTYVILMPRML